MNLKKVEIKLKSLVALSEYALSTQLGGPISERILQDPQAVQSAFIAYIWAAE